VIGAVNLDHIGGEGAGSLPVPVRVGGAADEQERTHRTAQRGHGRLVREQRREPHRRQASVGHERGGQLKHAGTTAAAVTLSGCAGKGLLVEVRNKLPVGGVVAEPAGELAGSGLGLVGLAERVALAGGTLAHGPDDSGDFVLTAAFPWQG
jgi:hypothetical protein